MPFIEGKSLLKDTLFNRERVSYLADLFVSSNPAFNKKQFVTEVMRAFPELELKARIGWIAEVLQRHVSSDLEEACAQITRALPPILDETLSDNDFGEFILAPLGEYIAHVVWTLKSVNRALDTLYEITKRFSMEDAVRTFLNNFPEETMARFGVWATDSNYHVRRLVSEGTRPLLPWSRRLQLPYIAMIPFLDKLYADKTRYVTRSVANHLNDISKINPAEVVKILKRWKKEGRQSPAELAWMTRHALRTLVKRCDRDALLLLGYTMATNVTVTLFDLENSETSFRRGETLCMVCTLMAPFDIAVLVDYSIDFVKANGQTKPKVFKWKKLLVKAGESIQLLKRHHLKSDATTFTLYPGEHTVTLQINGTKRESRVFIVQ